MKNGLPWVRSWIGSSSPSSEGSSPARSRSSSRVSASAQRLEREAAVGARVAPGRRVLGPEVDDRQRVACRSIAPTRSRQHHVAALVDPVQVLDHQDQRLAPAGRVDEPADDVRRAPAAAPRRSSAAPAGRGRGRRGSRTSAAGPRRSRGRAAAPGRRSSRARCCSGSRSPIPKKARSICSTGMNGIVRAVRLGLRLEDLDPLVRGSARRTRGRAGSCRRRVRRRSPTAPPSPAPRPPSASSKRRHLLGPADEAGEAALAREVEPRAGRADPGQLEDPDRPARALDLELAEVRRGRGSRRRARRCSRSGRPCRARPAPPSAAPGRPCGRSPCSRRRRPGRSRRRPPRRS